jgi:hypothetical protein
MKTKSELDVLEFSLKILILIGVFYIIMGLINSLGVAA